MRYIKLFEKIEIGGYAILKGSDTNTWNNWYGIIVDEIEPDSLYKIRVFNDITEDDRKEMSDYLEGKIIRAHINNFIYYYSKEKFESAIEKIEIDNATKKYNL